MPLSSDVEKMSPLMVEDVAHMILEGFHEGSQFGTAITTTDLNVDNITDIVVGAPGYGSDTLQYNVRNITGQVGLGVRSSMGNLQVRSSIPGDVDYTS